MIPIKLQIKNFLSYGSTLQTIDFSSHRLICLSGKNGHGKSALLDAITWAVWGQARKITGVAKSDQGLLRLGQTKMMVILDFNCGEQTYRVKREYVIINGKPYTTLDFGLRSKEHDRVIPLTDKSIRKTQTKIEQTIKLDYESFVNSAFLRQGNANEFSKKSPKDRKVVLANILGLNQYESIRKRASEKVKEAQLQQQRLSALQDKYEEELRSSSSITTEIKQVTNSLGQLKKQEKAITAEEIKLNTEQKKYTASYEKFTRSEQQHAALQEEHALQKQALTDVVALWRKTHGELLNLESKETLEKKRSALIKIVEEQQTHRNNHLILKEKLLQNTEKLHVQQRNLQKKYEAELYSQRLIIDRCKSENIAVTDTIKQSEEQIKELTQQIKTHKQELTAFKRSEPQKINRNEAESLRITFEKRKEKYHNFVAQGTAAQSELKALAQKATLANTSDGEPCCPLCEQNLSASRKKFLSKKFEESQKVLTHKIARLGSIVTKLKQYLIEKHEILKQYDASLQEERVRTIKQKQFQEKEIALTKSLEAAREGIQKTTQKQKKNNTLLAEHEKKLKELEKKAEQELTHDKELSNLQSSIKDLEKKAKDIAFDAQLYQKTQKELSVLEEKIKQHAHIKNSEKEQQQRKLSISQYCSTIKKIETELKQLEKISKTKAILETTKKDLELRQQEIARKQTDLRKEREAALQKMGSLERQQLFLKRVGIERDKLVQTIEKFKSTQDDYQAIAQATGKDGIQALLIEEAIPEIEDEANQILSYLTDNECHIILESLRNLKKGGTKETLDIKISDAHGIRPYELFSGGEAFRIDLALRIAISKLLTRRSGTTLQTLIIDEGFGSQDEEGLSHIMDSLYKLQDNFLKVIIVSHLTSMKNQFPVHLVVEKQSSGSTVKVIEHG